MENIGKKIKCPICDAEDNYLLDKKDNYILAQGNISYDLRKANLKGKCKVCKRIIKYSIQK